MLRDNLAGSSSRCAGAYPLALFNHNHQPSDDRPHALKIPAPIGAESTLTENAPSPFHAEPGQIRFRRLAADRSDHLLAAQRVPLRTKEPIRSASTMIPKMKARITGRRARADY